MNIGHLSVRNRVLILSSAAILSLVAITLAFTLTGVMARNHQNAQLGYNESADRTRRLEAQLLELHNDASNFLASKNIVFRRNFTSGVPEFEALIASVSDLSTDGDFGVLAQNYLELTESAFDERFQLGLTEDEGLEGALRAAVHDIERRLQVLGNEGLTIEMLMMRRHEKDFMMRLDAEYLDAFATRTNSFRAVLERQNIEPTEREAIVNLLDNYQTGFETWSDARLMLSYHVKNAEQLKEELLGSLRALSASLVQQSGSALSRQRQMIAVTVIALWGVVILLIAVCTALAFWIARSIVAEISGVSDEMLDLCMHYETNLQRPWRNASSSELQRMRNVLGFFAENLAETERLNQEVRYHRDHLAEQVERRTAQLEEKRLQLQVSLEQERELNHMQNQFVATVSHEFRTPLTIIDGAARRISRSLNKMSTEDIQNRLETVRSSVRRLSDMVEETLDSAKIAEGTIGCDIVCMDIVTSVRNIVARHEEISEGFTFEFNVSDMPECIDADPKLFDHIFSNLVSNAIKYSQQRPHVIISMRSTGDDVEVSVKDHGVGIPKSELPKITSRFFRASTSAGIKGTGIGMNLVAKLVQAHQGEMKIDSEEGQWTEVSLRLPIVSPLVTPKQAEERCCAQICAA